MHSSIRRIDIGRERVNVRTQQFSVSPVLQYRFHNRIVTFYLAEGLFVSRKITVPGPLDARSKLELRKQQFAHLLRRTEVEVRIASNAADQFFIACYAFPQSFRKRLQRAEVDSYAPGFHFCKHPYQWCLYVIVKFPCRFVHTGCQDIGNAARNEAASVASAVRSILRLPEKVSLYDDMTVKHYLHYRAKLKGEPSKRVRRRVSEAAELCQIVPYLSESIRTLSAGLCKRVALADALLLRPRVLLLDDFLSGLDQGMRETAGAILSNAAAFSSVIVTGHEIEDFSRWTTRFLVLRGGIVSSSVDATGLEPQTLRDRLDMAMKGGN